MCVVMWCIKAWYLFGHAMVVHDSDDGRRAMFDERGVHVDFVGTERMHACKHADARMLAAVDLLILFVGGILCAGRNDVAGILGLGLLSKDGLCDGLGIADE